MAFQYSMQCLDGKSRKTATKKNSCKNLHSRIAEESFFGNCKTTKPDSNDEGAKEVKSNRHEGAEEAKSNNHEGAEEAKRLLLPLLSQLPLLQLLSSSKLPKNDLIGQGKEKELVMEWLRNPTNEHRGTDLYKNISLLSIVGHDGMGKTTLLQHVFKEDEITEKFDPKM